MAEFRIVEDRDAWLHVALAGRLDHAGSEAIEGGLARQVLARRKPTLIDLSDVTFLASVGIGAIAALAKGLRLHGKALVLFAAPPLVERSLRLVALDKIVAIEPDLASALRRAGDA